MLKTSLIREVLICQLSSKYSELLYIRQMSSFEHIAPYIETNGQDKGRIKDVEVAHEVGLREDSWREEYDGKPVLPSDYYPAGYAPVFFSDLVQLAIEQTIYEYSGTDLQDDSIGTELEALHREVHDRAKDPETQDEAYYSWSIANKLYTEYCHRRGFDLDTCNEIAALPFPEAFETSYNYLTQAGINADEALRDFIE